MTRPEPGSEFLAIATLRPQCDYVKVPRCFFNRWQCTVSHIMVMSLRSKWAAGKAQGGRISQSIRNRRATQPPAHFQRNPLGRGRLAVFPRCSLDPYESRYGRFTASPARTALKNSQLTCGDITIICETVH